MFKYFFVCPVDLLCAEEGTTNLADCHIALILRCYHFSYLMLVCCCWSENTFPSPNRWLSEVVTDASLSLLVEFVSDGMALDRSRLFVLSELSLAFFFASGISNKSVLQSESLFSYGKSFLYLHKSWWWKWFVVGIVGTFVPRCCIGPNSLVSLCGSHAHYSCLGRVFVVVTLFVSNIL